MSARRVRAWAGPPGKQGPGYLLPHGEDVLFVPSYSDGLLVRVPRAELDGTGRRTLFQDQQGLYYRVAAEGADGEPAPVRLSPGVSADWRDWIVAASSPERRWFLALLVFASLVVGALWLTATPVMGTVVSAGRSCSVEFVGRDSTAHRVKVDCPFDAPPVGDAIPLRAYGWPLEGEAFSDLPLSDGGVAQLLLVGLPVGTVVLMGRLLFSAGAVRRKPVVLVHQADPLAIADGIRSSDLASIRITTDERMPGAAHEVTSHGTQQPTIRELAAARARLNAQAGQPQLADHPMATAGPSWDARFADLESALQDHFSWWPAVGCGVALVFFRDDIPVGWRPVLVPVMAAYLGWFGVAAVWRYRERARLWTQPFSSEWDYCVVTELEDEEDDPGLHRVFLLSEEKPVWELLVVDRPPQEGRLRVRGDLRDRGIVHLDIDGRLWIADMELWRVDDDDIEVLREELLGDLR